MKGGKNHHTISVNRKTRGPSILVYLLHRRVSFVNVIATIAQVTLELEDDGFTTSGCRVIPVNVWSDLHDTPSAPTPYKGGCNCAQIHNVSISMAPQSHVACSMEKQFAERYTAHTLHDSWQAFIPSHSSHSKMEDADFVFMNVISMSCAMAMLLCHF
jgi:hypothetical protein